MCGADLAGRRRDALACSSECGRERRRLLRLLAGEEDAGYLTVYAWLERRRRAAPQARRGALIAPPAAGRIEGHKAARRGVGSTADEPDQRSVHSHG